MKPFIVNLFIKSPNNMKKFLLLLVGCCLYMTAFTQEDDETPNIGADMEFHLFVGLNEYQPVSVNTNMATIRALWYSSEPNAFGEQLEIGGQTIGIRTYQGIGGDNIKLLRISDFHINRQIYYADKLFLTNQNGDPIGTSIVKNEEYLFKSSTTVGIDWKGFILTAGTHYNFLLSSRARHGLEGSYNGQNITSNTVRNRHFRFLNVGATGVVGWKFDRMSLSYILDYGFFNKLKNDGLPKERYFTSTFGLSFQLNGKEEEED